MNVFKFVLPIIAAAGVSISFQAKAKDIECGDLYDRPSPCTIQLNTVESEPLSIEKKNAMMGRSGGLYVPIWEDWVGINLDYATTFGLHLYNLGPYYSMRAGKGVAYRLSDSFVIVSKDYLYISPEGKEALEKIRDSEDDIARSNSKIIKEWDQATISKLIQKFPDAGAYRDNIGKLSEKLQTATTWDFYKSGRVIGGIFETYQNAELPGVYFVIFNRPRGEWRAE